MYVLRSEEATRWAYSTSGANVWIWRVAAGQVCQQVCEAFMGCVKIEGFSGPGVEAGGDSVEVGLSKTGQRHALGEGLAQQTVGVLVGAALSERGRVGEEDAHAGGVAPRSLGEVLVSGHLLALVVGQGLAQGRREGVQSRQRRWRRRPCGWASTRGAGSVWCARSEYCWRCWPGPGSSQWPSTKRAVTSSGRSAIGAMSHSMLRRSLLFGVRLRHGLPWRRQAVSSRCSAL